MKLVGKTIISVLALIGAYAVALSSHIVIKERKRFKKDKTKEKKES